MLVLAFQQLRVQFFLLNSYVHSRLYKNILVSNTSFERLRFRVQVERICNVLVFIIYAWQLKPFLNIIDNNIL